MDTKSIIEACSKIPNGRFFKIHWRSNCEKKMSAVARRDGHKVIKDVSSVCRKGIHYSHIQSVQESKISNGKFLIDPQTGKEEIIVEKREWAEDVVPNLIIKHKTTGKHYMLVYSTQTKPKSKYYLDGKAISAKALKDSGIMQNSYWNIDPSEECVVMTVPIESIVSIG